MATAAQPRSPMHLLDPKVLASLSNLELVAKAAVEGFVIGLHRSPKFGFSQEFVEYRAYGEGDDPRYIDYYGRPWAKNWEKYFEQGLEKPDSELPPEILDIFK